MADRYLREKIIAIETEVKALSLRLSELEKEVTKLSQLFARLTIKLQFFDRKLTELKGLIAEVDELRGIKEDAKEAIERYNRVADTVAEALGRIENLEERIRKLEEKKRRFSW